MNTLIFRTIAPLLTVVMLVFSVFVLLRGHNEPGGGFIGGLIAASAIAIYGMAIGAGAARQALRLHPTAIAGLGVVLATLAGLLSLAHDVPFLTGLWAVFHFGDTEVALSTPMLFDIGVYLVVFGTISAVALGLEDEGGRLMDHAIAALAGLFLTAAIYLLLSRSLIRMLLGMAILGNAVNLLIFVSGRLTRIVPPLALDGAYQPLEGAANPLPQALILTAIVIGFAMFSFLLVLAYRAYQSLEADDTDQMRLAEPRGGPQPPMSY